MDWIFDCCISWWSLYSACHYSGGRLGYDLNTLEGHIYRISSTSTAGATVFGEIEAVFAGLCFSGTLGWESVLPLGTGSIENIPNMNQVCYQTGTIGNFPRSVETFGMVSIIKMRHFNLC